MKRWRLSRPTARLVEGGAPGAARVVASAKRGARGMSLVEIMIVMAILVLCVGAVVAGTGQLAGARLKHGGTLLAGAIRVAYARANGTSRPQRLVFDFATRKVWIEESDGPALLQSKDTTGTGGADPSTDIERASQAAQAEGSRITSGVAVVRPRFHPVTTGELGDKGEGGKYEKPLPDKVSFRSVQTAHDDSARTDGRSYLYFWPGGQTERASIQLKTGESTDEAMTLLVSPLTGKVTIKSGSVPLTTPGDDKEASEREDTSL